MNKHMMQHAFNITFPTQIAYGALGIVFGVLFTHADFHWYLAPIMSAVVYAGAVQFVALSMMIDHAAIWSIVAATLFVALRNSLYGLSVMERFKKLSPLIRAYAVFGLVDSAYAILASTPEQEDDQAFCFWVTFFPYISWVLGTLLGAIFASYIPEVKGMEFILTAFFATLVIEYFLKHKSWDAVVVPVMLAFSTYYILPHHFLLLAIIGCMLYLYLKTKAST